MKKKSKQRLECVCDRLLQRIARCTMSKSLFGLVGVRAHGGEVARTRHTTHEKRAAVLGSRRDGKSEWLQAPGSQTSVPARAVWASAEERTKRPDLQRLQRRKTSPSAAVLVRCCCAPGCETRLATQQRRFVYLRLVCVFPSVLGRVRSGRAIRSQRRATRLAHTAAIAGDW